jgi:hypothetical protein
MAAVETSGIRCPSWEEELNGGGGAYRRRGGGPAAPTLSPAGVTLGPDAT